MKAYKFRGADQIPFALDIILNDRLHCADWRTFNDPLEGLFGCSYSPDKEEIIEKQISAVMTQKQSLKICSLSLTYNCHLLWSHYASGFRGLAIEVDLPDQADEVEKIQYKDLLSCMDLNMDKRSEDSALETARSIFSSKYEEWGYEEEVRIIHNEELYTLRQGVSRVICGHRMNEAMFEALNIVCKQKGIPIARIGIGPDSLNVRNVPLDN